MSGKWCLAGQILVYPSSATTDLTVNTIKGWNNPENALVEDGLFASTAATTQLIRLKGFNPNIPMNATIQGIQFDIKEQGVTAVIDSVVELILPSGTTSNNKSLFVDWPTTLGFITYGGPTDTWGLTITPAQINDPTFTIAVSCSKDAGGTQTANIDVGRMTVFYNVTTSIMNGVIYNATLR